MSNSSKKPFKHKFRGSNENITTKTYVPKTNNTEPSNRRTRPKEPSPPLTNITSSPDHPPISSQEKDKQVTYITLSDFKFNPKEIRIKINTTISWKIGENREQQHSSIYNPDQRAFVIGIPDLDVESDLLYRGAEFEYTFTQQGAYEVKCMNYARISQIVEVYEDEQENMMMKLQENYKERGAYLKNTDREINELIRTKIMSPTKTSASRGNSYERILTKEDLYADGTKKLISELQQTKIHKSWNDSESDNEREDKKSSIRERNNTSLNSCDLEAAFQDFLARDMLDEENKTDFDFFQGDMSYKTDPNALDDMMAGNIEPKIDILLQGSRVQVDLEQTFSKTLDSPTSLLQEDATSFLKRYIKYNKDKFFPHGIVPIIKEVSEEKNQGSDHKIGVLKNFLMNRYNFCQSIENAQ